MAILGVKTVKFGQIGGQNSLFLIKKGIFFEIGKFNLPTFFYTRKIAFICEWPSRRTAIRKYHL